MASPPDVEGLYAASYRRLVVQLFAVCGDLSTAEDAVQDAFVTALRKSRELRSVANPEAWVRTVALNRVRSGWRHAAVVCGTAVTSPGPRATSRSGPSTWPWFGHWVSWTLTSGSSWCCTTSPISGSPRSHPSSGSPKAP